MPMRPHSRQEETNEQQNTDAPAGSAADGAATPPGPAAAAVSRERSPAEIARIRRRVILAALAILAVLLVAGLGESFAGFIPHATPPFANGATQTAGALRVTIQFSPNPPKISGDPTTQVKLLIQSQNNQTIDNAQVQLDLSMVTMDMGGSRFAASGLGQGRYQADVAFLMIGQWHVTVNVSPPGGAAVTTTFTVDVAA